MLGQVFCEFSFCVSSARYSVSLFSVLSTSAINCLETLVSKMTCYVSINVKP